MADELLSDFSLLSIIYKGTLHCTQCNLNRCECRSLFVNTAVKHLNIFSEFFHKIFFRQRKTRNRKMIASLSCIRVSNRTDLDFVFTLICLRLTSGKESITCILNFQEQAVKLTAEL